MIYTIYRVHVHLYLDAESPARHVPIDSRVDHMDNSIVALICINE